MMPLRPLALMPASGATPLMYPQGIRVRISMNSIHIPFVIKKFIVSSRNKCSLLKVLIYQ